MEPLHRKATKGPEAKIQTAIIHELRARDVHVEVMHGNMLQYGIPDLKQVIVTGKQIGRAHV